MVVGIEAYFLGASVMKFTEVLGRLLEYGSTPARRSFYRP